MLFTSKYNIFMRETFGGGSHSLACILHPELTFIITSNVGIFYNFYFQTPHHLFEITNLLKSYI